MVNIILCAACVVLAAVFVDQERRQHYLPAVILKGAASLCFVILGILGTRIAGDDRVARLIVIGLALGFAADILLNLRFMLPKFGQMIFLLGILVFLGGHVMYLWAISPSFYHFIICLVPTAGITFVLMRWIFTKIEAKKAFRIFGIFYIGVIVWLNCVAAGNVYAASNGFHWTFLLGALLFVVSDVVLILNTFGPEQKFRLRALNLGLYYVGQLLIALSLQLIW